MHPPDDVTYEAIREQIFRSQRKVIAIVVLALSIAAWWSQGFIRAVVGGVSLFAVLMLTVTASNYFEDRKRQRDALARGPQ